MKLLPLSVLKEGTCVGDDPWGPKVQFPLTIRSRHLRGVPFVGCMCLSAVAGLLLQHSMGGMWMLTLLAMAWLWCRNSSSFKPKGFDY